MLTNVQTVLQSTQATFSPNTPIRYYGVFRINAEKFRSGGDNPRVLTYINGVPDTNIFPNRIRRIGGTYPNTGGFIDAIEIFEVTAQGSAWYTGPGTYTLEYVMTVDHDIPSCQRTIRNTPISFVISGSSMTQQSCSKLTNIQTTLQSTSAIISPATPIRLHGFFRMNADNFRSGASNPHIFLHINNGKGLKAIDYPANGIHFLGGTYPNNFGYIEATENFELIAEGSAWYNGPGTYTFEYRLLIDDGINGCQRTMRSTPVSVTIGNTIGNLSTNDCSILTNILTLLQSTSAIISTTPIRFQGIFRINAEKFKSGAGNPQSVTYINGVPLSSYSPNGFRYLSGTYPTNAGFLEATEFLEITPKGSAWYKGPGTYTIEYGLIVDNGNSACQRSVRSIPVTVRIDEPTTTSNITFSIAPNPTSSDVQIDITVSKGTSMQCELYDVAGRKVMNVFEGTYSAGKLTFKVSLSNLPQGTYFCKITTPSETMQQKIQLIR